MKSLNEDVRQSGNYSFNLFVKRNLLSAIELLDNWLNK